MRHNFNEIHFCRFIKKNRVQLLIYEGLIESIPAFVDSLKRMHEEEYLYDHIITLVGLLTRSNNDL